MSIERRKFLTGLAAVGGSTLLGPIASSAQQRTQRYSKPVIDAHVHWYPPEFVELFVKEGEANGAKIRGPNKDGEWTANVPGGQYYSPNGSTFRREMMDIDLMIKAMDDREVDLSVLAQTNPHVVWAQPEFGLKLSRAVNDANSALSVKYPKRFMGTITLPMQDPRLALQELDRGAKLPGMRAVNITENVNGKNLSEKSFWPVYERCEALDLPLFLHNVNPIHERLVEQDFSMMNELGNPFEATIAATALVFGGVMDAFPKLDVFLPHAGGFFPFAVWRMDFSMSQGILRNLKQLPSTYLRRFHYDLILHSPKLTRTLIDLVGADRVVCGTDFPQLMSIRRPVEYVEAIPGITRRECEMILCENPARLLGL
jgi:aminocarboxymuconate-semialdehyde decarboxylase